MNIFARFFVMIDEHLNAYFDATLDAIAGPLSATVTTFAVIAVIAGGVGVMFGRGAMSPFEWIKSLGIIALVSTLVSSGAEFNTYIASYLRALPDFMLEQSTSGAAGGTIGERLDAIVRNGLDGFSALWAAAGWSDFGVIMIAVVLFVALLLFSVAAAITLVISKVGLTLVVVMGPILLPALFFDATRDLFTRWVTYALSFAALAFLVGGVMGVADSVIGEYTASMLEEREDFDRMAIAGAEVGVIFCTLMLVTGPIWAKGTWGKWWSWDPRLTVTLLLWFIYVAYILLRSFSDGGSRSARFAAVYGIVGVILIPLNYYIIEIFDNRSMHPDNLERGSLGAGMGLPFLLGNLALFFAFAYLVMLRWEVETLRTVAAQDEAEGEQIAGEPL